MYTAGVMGLSFSIESSQYDPIVLEQKITEFISKYFKEDLTEKKYNNFLEGLITSKSEPFKDIFDEMRHFMEALKEYALG